MSLIQIGLQNFPVATWYGEILKPLNNRNGMDSSADDSQPTARFKIIRTHAGPTQSLMQFVAGHGSASLEELQKQARGRFRQFWRALSGSLPCSLQQVVKELIDTQQRVFHAEGDAISRIHLSIVAAVKFQRLAAQNH